MNLMKTGIDDVLYKIVAKEVHDMHSGNPYTPEAGTPPAYLAGRDQLIKDSTTLMDNVLNGDMARHTIFYGVRGVGKTVLLNKLVQSTLDEYFRQLDESFYSSRYNRTTNAEKSFLRAMAAIGDYPCQMADVACHMGKTVPSISQFRANLMNKGLVYAPAYGVVDFTVPCFDDFLKRTK